MSAKKARAKRKASKRAAKAPRPHKRKRAPKPPPEPARRFEPAAYARKLGGILGMGRSGLHIANLLAKKGYKVLVSESKPHKDVRPLAKKLKPGVKWEAGGHSDRLLGAKFVVKSPGIPSHAAILGKLKEAHVPVFSELETALAFSKGREIVAVTGTNGKSTTTLLLGEVFKAARKRTLVGGNIGTAASIVAPQAKKGDVLVLEVSSYQLEDSRYFHPTAAAVLNVTADHVDHHGSMDAYIAAKARIFQYQHKGDVCVFNGDDPIAVKMARQCPARKLFFSHRPSTLSHAWIDNGAIRVRLPGSKTETKLAPPDLPGAHNLENAMAAALIALDRKIAPKAIQKAFKAFKGVEHRIEDCGLPRGIRCVNDSKATNVESTLTALKALANGNSEPKILLILGGLHKGYPYTPLRPYLGTSIKGILTIGSASGKIEEDLSGPVPIFPCGTIESAVQTAFQIGQKGDLLLLSPACASFDQFKDYEHRGRRFKELVSSHGKGR
ncbi:MAG: UDP-N-acetylmuramoyl-L-alanine--D-glutamate ligase [Elusimicrobia bacterium]|nr:UDP-N-acetylmuramoyl-L-alanine--D-glutamate ligase [Elusimicrobiota bacterium]